MSKKLTGPRGIVIGHRHTAQIGGPSKVWFPQDKLSHFMSNHICKKEMTRDEYAREVFGIFQPDPRTLAVDEKFDEYHRDTELLGNKEALIYWKRLLSWCDYNGYTITEISTAKQRSSGRR